MNTQQIIGFHNPDEEYGYLSNWYRSDFEKDGIRLSSMEQYMMYQKALCFRDEKIAAEVLKTDDVGRIKELAVRFQTMMKADGTACARSSSMKASSRSLRRTKT